MQKLVDDLNLTTEKIKLGKDVVECGGNVSINIERS